MKKWAFDPKNGEKRVKWMMMSHHTIFNGQKQPVSKPAEKARWEPPGASWGVLKPAERALELAGRALEPAGRPWSQLGGPLIQLRGFCICSFLWAAGKVL